MSISAVILNTAYGLETYSAGSGSGLDVSSIATAPTAMETDMILSITTGSEEDDIDDLVSLLNEMKDHAGLRVDDSGDTVILRAGDGDDSIVLNSDTTVEIVGGKGDDVLNAQGSEAGQVLIGAAGDDQLTGGAGGDTLKGGAGQDVITGGAGADELRGGAGQDMIAAGKGDDLVSGGKDDDALSGDAGNDALRGNAGQDELMGKAGNDTLNGGSGNDVLVGGKGDDQYVFMAGSGHDTVRGYDMGAPDADQDQMVMHDTGGKLSASVDGDGTLRLWLGTDYDRSVRVEFDGDAASYATLTDADLASALNIVLR